MELSFPGRPISTVAGTLRLWTGFQQGKKKRLCKELVSFVGVCKGGRERDVSLFCLPMDKAEEVLMMIILTFEHVEISCNSSTISNLSTVSFN